MSSSRRTIVLACCGVAGLLGPASAAARPHHGLQDPPSQVEAPQIGPSLSRGALRACMRSQRQLEAQQGEIDRLEAQLDVTENAIRLAEARISSASPLVDPQDPTTIARLDAQLATHTELLATYHRQLPTLNERLDALDERIDEFNGQCADRSYRESDLRAIEAEL